MVTVRHEDILLRMDLRDEGVAQTIYRDRSYEPLETSFIRSRLRTGDVFIDIGANIGVHSLKAARIVGPLGLVIAFEPEPYNFGLLRRNITLNGATEIVKPINAAIGDEPGVARIYSSSSNFGDHRLYHSAENERPFTDVIVNRLDAALLDLRVDRVDFIKIDVQGFEEKVVSGMAGLFESKLRPTIMLEFWPIGIQAAGGVPERILSALSTLGYQLHTLSPTGLKALSYEAVWESIPPAEPERVDASALNLVFIHR